MIERLAVYGSLAPGRPNEHVLADITGRWRSGTVCGILRAEGWGADLGYPGIVLDPAGPAVDVALFESAELAAHWERLDDFEGHGYRRTLTTVDTADGSRSAWIYVLA
ncbi:MAG: gamma-glutamylcyclotransferase family protein [Actinomycetota bacterium]